MTARRSEHRLSLSGLIVIFLGGCPVLGQEQASISVDWTMSPVLQECEGPCDPGGVCWKDEGFDDSLWEPVLLPHEDRVDGIADRFFRGAFTLDSAKDVVLCMSSRLGLEVFLNGESLGSWGGACHGNRCVNMPCGGLVDRVPPSTCRTTYDPA
jgi:hypothetical protein